MLRDYSELMIISWLSACFISNGEFILSTTYSEFDIFNQFAIVNNYVFYDLIVEKRICARIVSYWWNLNKRRRLHLILQKMLRATQIKPNSI